MTARVSSAGSESRNGRLQALWRRRAPSRDARLGGHAEAAGDVADLHAAVFAGIVLDELVDGGFDGALGALSPSSAGDDGDDLVERHRLFGGVDDGFDLGF